MSIILRMLLITVGNMNFNTKTHFYIFSSVLQKSFSWPYVSQKENFSNDTKYYSSFILVISIPAYSYFISQAGCVFIQHILHNMVCKNPILSIIMMYEPT